MSISVAPDQRLQLDAALAVIQWKHAFAIRLRQRTSELKLAPSTGDRRPVPPGRPDAFFSSSKTS